MKSFKSVIATTVAATMVLAGCLTVDVADPAICDSQAVSFPAPSVPTIPSQYQGTATCSMYSVTIPSVSTTTTVDLSQSLSKLDNVADQLSITVTELTLDNSHGFFNWAPSVDVQISGKGLPMKELAHYIMPQTGMPSQVSFQVVMSGNDALTYLNNGPATLTISLNSATVTACDAETVLANGSNLSSSVNLCVYAHGSFSKSL